MNTFSSNFTCRHFLRLVAAGAATSATGLRGESNRRFPVGFEIGDTQVSVAVGERFPDGTIELLAVSRKTLPTAESITATVNQALADAEAQSAVFIRGVVFAVSEATRALLSPEIKNINMTATYIIIPAPRITRDNRASRKTSVFLRALCGKKRDSPQSTGTPYGLVEQGVTGEVIREDTERHRGWEGCHWLNGSIRGPEEWLNDPRHACAIGLLRFA